MAEMIRVLLVEPMEKPRLVTLEHTLKNLQKLVDGYIQALYPWDEDPVAVVCDEDGIEHGRIPNRVLEDEEGNIYDILKGTFFICGVGKENFCSISDALAEKYTEKFLWLELFMRAQDGHVVWMKLKTGEQPKVIV